VVIKGPDKKIIINAIVQCIYVYIYQHYVHGTVPNPTHGVTHSV